MDKMNVTAALTRVEMDSFQVQSRIDAILDHFNGPRPQQDNPPCGPVPGLVATVERLQFNIGRTLAVIDQIESTLGIRPPQIAQQCMSNQSPLANALLGAYQHR